MFKIATWNVNSLRVRLEQVCSWLKAQDCDLLALQETKLVDAQFPMAIFNEMGYQAVYTGQKTYNGVALVSRYPLESVLFQAPNYPDPERRVLAATVQGIRIINLYIPNGAALGTDKFAYKMRWLQEILAFVKAELAEHPKLLLLGDFNIAPEDKDVHDPSAWAGSVLVSPEERAFFQSFLDLGLVDSYRHRQPDRIAYSWWDYRLAGFRRNRGLRIDHILISQALLADCQRVEIDIEPRRAERPSDHTPVYLELAQGE